MNELVVLNYMDMPVQFHRKACSAAILTEQEERELLLCCKTHSQDTIEYKQSLQSIIYHYMRYISKIGLKLYNNSVQSFKEIISEGIYGMIDAVKNFDLSKNVRFITYASWWVKYRIGEWLKSKSVIKGCDNIISLNAPIENTDDKCTIEDTIPCEYSSIDEYVDREHDTGCSVILKDALSCLNEREIDIVKRYNKGDSLENIASDYGISRERIRQINMRAMEKMKKYLIENKNIKSIVDI